MGIVKRLIQLAILIFVGAVLCYYLPGRDIVQVVGIEVSREDFKNIDQTSTGQNRDVRYVNAEWPNGNPRVYRNEDAPLYLKFDSGNLNATAQSLGNKHANREEPEWVKIRHYGWRIPYLSMYPNALSIKSVPGPDIRLIPWFNIIFLSMMFALWLWIWMSWRKFRKKRIDPVADKIEETADAIGDEVNETKEGAGKFFRRWFGSSK